MEAKELRLGNWIDSGSNTPSQVIGVYETSDEHGDVMVVNSDKGICYETEVNPIELTEDWFVKWGAQHDHKSKGAQHSFFTLKINEEYRFTWQLKDRYIVLHEKGVGVIMGLKHITQVHQFQNLVFTLTGKELQLIKSK
jgi:hypothetical protein